MQLTFNIEYRTNWGEEVRVSGSPKELGRWEETEAFALHTTDGIHWSAQIEINAPAEESIQYTYYIYKEGKPVRKEWDTVVRRLYTGKGENKRFITYDFWKNIPDQLYLYSSAFTECLLPRKKEISKMESYEKEWVVKAYCPRLKKDYALGIGGNQAALGNWDLQKALLLSDRYAPEWQITLDATKLKFPLEYKFVLYNLKEKKAEEWEMNPNRYLADPDIADGETLVLSDRYVRFDLPDWKGAGVAVPVFSLKSADSYGVGDFGDLKKIIDWAIHTHQKVVQILPVNDTSMTHTWTDSYPYNSISIYAFHPMYANLGTLGTLKDKKKATYFAEKQKELNTCTTVDYEAVNKIKWEYFRLIFAQEGAKIMESEDFRNFFANNREWLIPYAAFSYLRDVYHTPDFRKWPRYSAFKTEEIEELCCPESKDYNSIALYFYIQYHLHRQLLEASTYARAHGVVLKGDIPIGISRNSVEAWTEPHYFNQNGQAGAPPDDFSANGQNWGFPTYNWEVMEKDGYRWWMKRFRKMAEYFDAYRIDHILGFFRIWEIPLHAVHGLLGQFVPSLPMSRKEIESYGLIFNEEEFLKPYIHEHSLPQRFGSHTETVKKMFLQATQEERYEMKPEFDTQRKIETYFQSETDADHIRIRDGLYSLVSDVLFIRDQTDPERFHPRISAQNDFVYQTLSDSDKAAFNRLYNHYYYHRHNEFWRDQALKKLPQLIRSTRMLVCGEDLGMIPDCVAWVMNHLQILSLEIQRMPKNPAHEFGHLDEYPYRSVCTPSTHDMSTLRGWWEEDARQTQRYYNHVLKHPGTAPAKAGGPLCEEIVRQHLCSGSMLSILSLQDWMSIDERWRNPDVEAERINIPANPRHYWHYRMHLSIEELMQAESLNEKIIRLIGQTGRNPEK